MWNLVAYLYMNVLLTIFYYGFSNCSSWNCVCRRTVLGNSGTATVERIQISICLRRKVSWRAARRQQSPRKEKFSSRPGMNLRRQHKTIIILWSGAPHLCCDLHKTLDICDMSKQATDVISWMLYIELYSQKPKSVSWDFVSCDQELDFRNGLGLTSIEALPTRSSLSLCKQKWLMFY